MNNRESILQEEILDTVLQWDSEKMFSVFGNYLETVVKIEREKHLKKLKAIWRNRRNYAYKDTGQQLDEYDMKYFFNPKFYRNYSLDDMQQILERIENELSHSKPAYN